MNKKYLACYETDASRLIGKAEKVVFPKTVEEVQKIIKTSNLDIVPRGAGTSLVGGSIPNNSVVVDLNKMNKIIDFDKTNKVVYVEAGISIKELNEKLDSIGFEFPVLPLNQASTLGGMTAVNSLGSREMRYGRMRDWIKEIEFVDGGGELVKTSKTDLTDVCGMEGITGIIVKVKLKVASKIKRSISVFQTNSLNEILSIARRLKSESDAVMLELFSRQVSKLLGLSEKYHLIVEFDSDRGKIKGREYKKIVKLKEKVYYVLSDEQYYNIENYKFFFDKLKEFILYLESKQIPYFGYLGSGVVYSFFKDGEETRKKEMIGLIKKIGGKIGEGGIGIKRKDFLDDFEKKIIQRIKLRYDPFRKLNKGKIIDFGERINRREVESLEGEKLSARKFENEIKRKTPEEKINEFIEEIGSVEDKKEEEEEDLEEDLDEAQEILKDYEFTYDSELPEPRRKKVEEFAKDVPKKIELKGKLSKKEQDMVDKVMMGGFGFHGDKEEGNGEKEK